MAHVVERTEAEGPGVRFALWVQGCAIRCPGCCNPHLFEREGGRDASVAALAAGLRALRHDVEGVTFLGGEPFEQAAPLAVLAASARELGLGVMTFTGHRLEDLVAGGGAGARDLLASTDLLVDSPYDARLPERRRRWAGSTNQRFHFLTRRYAPGIERVEAGEVERTVEVRIAPDGVAHVNGWPELRRPLGG